MSTITKDVIIPLDRKITLELPADCPAGQAKITVIVEPEPLNDTDAGKSGIAKLRGTGRGKIWMADDFAAPLEDFAEYM